MTTTRQDENSPARHLDRPVTQWQWERVKEERDEARAREKRAEEECTRWRDKSEWHRRSSLAEFQHTTTLLTYLRSAFEFSQDGAENIDEGLLNGWRVGVAMLLREDDA